MTYNQIRDVVSKVKYKKLEFFVDRDHSMGFTVVRLKGLVTCIFTGNQIPLENRVCMPDSGLDEEMLVALLFNACVEWERHEVGEFFVYDSTRPFDPHKREPGHVTKPATVYELWAQAEVIGRMQLDHWDIIRASKRRAMGLEDVS